MTYDLAIVGAGILGLAHALAATRRGLKTVVIDREAQAIGASVRNFGFITVTGQQAGACWHRAMRSRDVWAEVAPKAGIPVEHHGTLIPAQRLEAMAVLEAFARTDMGAECRLLTPATLKARHGAVLTNRDWQGALWSPHELRVESRHAIPRLAAYLETIGTTFRRQTLVTHVEPGHITTTTGAIQAETIVVCPGDDLLTLFPDRIAALGIARCRLNMMKITPGAGFRLPGAVMSDLSLIRYLGWSELPEAAALKARLQREQPDHLAQGIHLIAVQGADGGLIVGDSHHFEPSPSPFQSGLVDDLIRHELHQVLNLPGAHTTEHWMGTYATLPDRLMVMDAPAPAIRLVIITSGTGASTSFAIAEETLTDLYGKPTP